MFFQEFVALSILVVTKPLLSLGALDVAEVANDLAQVGDPAFEALMCCSKRQGVRDVENWASANAMLFHQDHGLAHFDAAALPLPPLLLLLPLLKLEKPVVHPQ
jgi:hypothetical protein